MLNMGELFKYPRIPNVEMARVNIDTRDEERTLLRAGDLMFARRSLTWEGAGKCSIVRELVEPTTWESSIIRARLNRRVAVPEYFFYYFLSPQGRRQVETIIEQVAAAGIRLSELRRLEVPVPELRTQYAIADVLGALDDKVAANEYSTGLALMLAQAEFTQAAHSLAGRCASFESVADIGGGGTPRTAVHDYWGGDINWATPTDVTRLQAPYLTCTGRTITYAGLAVCSSPIYPVGSILMTSRATIGAFAIAKVPLAVNQGFIVVNARDRAYQWWLFHEMRARVDDFLSHANGATFLELPRGKFKKLNLRVPTAEQAGSFSSRVEPLHDMASQLMEETAILARTRDELLPLLMSGQIRVRDAEKVVEEVA